MTARLGGSRERQREVCQGCWEEKEKVDRWGENMSVGVFVSSAPLFVLVLLQNWRQTRGCIIGAPSHGCLTPRLLSVYKAAAAVKVCEGSDPPPLPNWRHQHQPKFPARDFNKV